MECLDLFLDTEFTDFENTDLISIGLVAASGETFYGEKTNFMREWASSWVQENVCNLLDPVASGHPSSGLAVKLWEWLDALDSEHVRIIVDFGDRDFALMTNLLVDKHPKIVGSVNLFALIRNKSAEKGKKLGWAGSSLIASKAEEVYNSQFFEYFKRNKEIQHHALSDAKAIACAYCAALQFIDDFEDTPHV